MAAPSVRSFTEDVSGTTTLVLNKPAGVVSGDLLLAILFPVGPPDATKTVTPTDGGFTEIVNAATFVGDGMWRGDLRAFRKAAGGSEPSSYTFTTANIDHFAGVLVAIQGAAPGSDPAAVQATIEDAASLVLSGLSAAQNESLILVAQIGWDTLGDAALPTAAGLTFTEQFDDAGNDIAFATAIKATAGAVGNITIAALDFRFCAFALAIAPAAVGATVDLGGVIGGRSLSQASLTVVRSLKGRAQGQGRAIGASAVTRPLSGVAVGRGRAAGATSITRLLTGRVRGGTSAQAVAGALRSLSSAIAGRANVIGNLGTVALMALAGLVAGCSSVQGTLSIVRNLSGRTDGRARTTGPVSIVRNLAGRIAGGSTVQSAASALRSLAGRAQGIARTLGALFQPGQTAETLTATVSNEPAATATAGNESAVTATANNDAL